jgi:outer membrane protein assembly factor BamB
MAERSTCDMSRMRWTRLVLSWLVSVSLVLVTSRLEAQPPGPVENPAAPLTPQQRAALNHVLYRSPQMTAFITRAKGAIESGDLRNGLRMLQQILGDPRGAADRAAGGIAPSDSFAWSETGLKSQRREVLDIFESLTDEQLETYERTYGTLATEALQQAEASGDLTQLQEVVRRCWPTAAGAQAIDRLATRLLDRDQAETAARLWNGLANSRVHRFRVSESIFEKAAVAYLLAGKSEAAEAMLRQQEARYGVRPLSVADLERELTSRVPQIGGWPEEWTTPFGSSGHNTVSAGTTPWLEPQWSQPLNSSPSFEMLADWEKRQVANEVESVAGATTPIVANGLIVVRDFDGVRACDPATGRIVWRYDATLSLSQLADAVLSSRYLTSSWSIMEMAWVGNAAIGMVSSDGDRVFAVDWVEFSATAPATQKGARRYSGPTISALNRLVCLPTSAGTSEPASDGSPQRVEPLWVAGGTPTPSPTDQLGGHLFVGPPIVSGDSVFVIVESGRDKELKLARLDARTGQLQWMQTLGIVEQPTFSATDRLSRLSSCIPAIGEGIAVCPTDAGYLVGVDTVTGELLWMQTYFEMRLPSRFGSTILREADGAFVGYRDPPHIDDGRVVYLPRHSEELHCYGLQSGEELWHVPREDGQYVGAIRNGVACIVGKSTVRGVSLDDGRTLWKRRIGVTSGRGVLTDDGYLLPLKAGGVARIDLMTGKRQGSNIVPALLNRQFTRSMSTDDAQLPRSSQEVALARFGLVDESLDAELRPGNLLLHDRQVFSVGPHTITAFPQADSLLLDLRARRDSTQGPSVDPFQLACLELLLGHQAEGEDTLAELARQKQHPQRTKARWMLRNLILADLRRADDTLTAARFRVRVQQFQSLIDSPFDEQQLLFEKVRWEQRQGDRDAVLQLLAGLSQVQLQSFLPQDDGFESVVASSSLSRSLIRDALRIEADAGNNPLRDTMNRDLLAALRSNSLPEMRRFIELYGDSPQAARIRNRLADRLIQNGDVQAAELTLLPNLSLAERQEQAVAQILYITLLTQEQLDGEAGRALLDGLQNCRGVSIDHLRTDSLQSPLAVLAQRNRFTELESPVFDDFVAAFDRDRQAWSAYLDCQRPAWNVRQVVIRPRPFSAADPELVRLWTQTPRQLSLSDDKEFHLLHNGSYVNSWWKLVDRYAGIERGSIRVPSRPSIANAQAYRTIGHLVPVGAEASLTGISLLEYRNQAPLWQFSFPPTQTARETLEPGPSTPTVCVFQTRKHLIAVDPRNGNVLWRRSDLDMESGVTVDREFGLLGDDHVIVIFHRDQQSYTRLDALTGAILNTGKLASDFRYGRAVFGRKLYHRSTIDDKGQQFARIWDPLTETLELDEPINGRLLDEENGDELGLLDTNGRLRVYQMPDVRLLVDTDLGKSATQSVTTFKFFSDEERFYINLARPQPRRQQSAPRHYPVTNSLPSWPLDPGLLLAVDRVTGRIIWRRHVTHQSLLRLEQFDLPFFVGMSRVGQTNQAGSVQTLEVEVFDRATGETIGHERNLMSDRFVHYQLNDNRGTLKLHGLSSSIEIDFRVPPPGILLEQRPL